MRRLLLRGAAYVAEAVGYTVLTTAAWAAFIAGALWIVPHVWAVVS